jgi:regulator of protease activity HflC (stomatin/prohibitin superfamily)
MIIRNLQPYHLKVVSNVNITNFKFSKLFGQAIEEKQVAEQTARKRRYLLQGAVIKAKQTIVTAKAEAKAMKLKELSVTPTLVQWEAVQKWDGKLPNITGGNIPFIMSLPKHYVNGKPN